MTVLKTSELKARIGAILDQGKARPGLRGMESKPSNTIVSSDALGATTGRWLRQCESELVGCLKS